MKKAKIAIASALLVAAVATGCTPTDKQLNREKADALVETFENSVSGTVTLTYTADYKLDVVSESASAKAFAKTIKDVTTIEADFTAGNYYLHAKRVGRNLLTETEDKTVEALVWKDGDTYKYLEQNPHLVQAMRNVDAEGFEKINNYVPDELTKKVKELEDYIEEQKYNNYVNGLKNKYSDFDEDKILEYAEKHNVYDLEVAYKAMKADSIKEPNIEELRKQIKEELLNELKQNSLETQSIVGGLSQKPIKQDDTVKLSSREERIAKAMGISPTEYAKWR